MKKDFVKNQYFYNYWYTKKNVEIINNVNLIGERTPLVFYNGQLHLSEIPSERWNKTLYLNCYALVRYYFLRASVMKPKGDVVYFKLSSNWSSFGHFVIEELPRLERALNHICNTNLKLIILLNRDEADWKIEAVTKVIKTVPNTKLELFSSNLVVESFLDVGFQPICEETVSMSRKLLTKVHEREVYHREFDILFMRRSDSLSYCGILRNDKLIISHLRNLGFKVVDVEPEKLTLSEQIRLVQECKILIGPQGSNLALFPLLESNQFLIILYGARVHRGFEQYAKVAGVNVFSFFIEAFGPSSNFSVSQEEIEEISAFIGITLNDLK